MPCHAAKSLGNIQNWFCQILRQHPKLDLPNHDAFLQPPCALVDGVVVTGRCPSAGHETWGLASKQNMHPVSAQGQMENHLYMIDPRERDKETNLRRTPRRGQRKAQQEKRPGNGKRQKQHTTTGGEHEQRKPRQHQEPTDIKGK